MKRVTQFAMVAAFTLALSMHAAAQGRLYRLEMKQGGVASDNQPELLKRVSIDQRLNEQLPLDATFKDDHGDTVQLASYFNGGRPMILAMVYYECPMLCNQVLNGLTSALGVLKFDAAQEFDVLAISIDPRETPKIAAGKKKMYLHRYGRPGAEKGWHFLTGDKASIDRVAEAVGFRYMWDEKTQQYAHASGIMVVTPQGKLAQYYYGIEYAPRDLRLGLVEASKNQIGTVVDQLLLFCYHYDPTTGKYGAIAMNVMRAGGVLTLVVLGSFIAVSLRRERKGSGAIIWERAAETERTGRAG